MDYEAILEAIRRALKDAEADEALALANAHLDGYPPQNPPGWQEVDGVQLPPITVTWE